MSVLLDTDASSALMRGHPVVAARVRETDRVLLPTIVVGELLFGFRCGTRYERNRRNLEVFLQNANVALLPATWATAERFERIAAALRAKGKPIPINDIWIAAHAMETGAGVLSFDSPLQQHRRARLGRPLPKSDEGEDRADLAVALSAAVRRGSRRATSCPSRRRRPPGRP